MYAAPIRNPIPLSQSFQTNELAVPLVLDPKNSKEHATGVTTTHQDHPNHKDEMPHPVKIIDL